MIDVSWRIPDEEREPEFTGAPRPLMGTWHYLHNALRREWRTWVGLALLGLLVGVAFVLVLPASSRATVTLLMVHPANLDAQSAMATDVSLLNTREVSARTVRKLGLDVDADAFQSTISAEPVTTEILTITVSAPNGTSALRRADTLATEYLDFRAEQLQSLSSGLINGYQSRITSMQKEVSSLNEQYDRASGQGSAGQTAAGDILTRRSQLNAQIYDMQQAIADAALTTDAAVSSTHVIDPARIVQHSTKKALVLDSASGLLAGAALGVGLVGFRALTSARIRRREDVALAMRAPVRFSVARRRRLGRGRGRRSPSDREFANRDLETLVRGLESAVFPGAPLGEVSDHKEALRGSRLTGPVRGVALAAIRNQPVAATVLSALASRLHDSGITVFLVDLSSSGVLATRGQRRKGIVAPHAAAPKGPEVFRPTGNPALAQGPLGLDEDGVVDLPTDGRWHDDWESADVVLALVEVDPGIYADNLRSWVGRLVPLVTAGKSSPELLETTAELVRSAGLELPFVMMVGADETDESLGAVDTLSPAVDAELERT
jgi:capsular polysaccharide biosynthesis protein